ncbi:nucleotidyltransferase domain-containing protein [Synechocystis sp. PCC 7509]|uniref:nucleotidyltransferase domain-containing protein n=1 Tax=Synechocystis sp. PCC 7509 TaxID=927677 RepID=UPI0002ACAF8C|nr:nucleotidyltransferase domain-containing protein [Synechocystis sp. PCC 7509]
MPFQQLIEIAKNQPYPLLFATVSGAHLYGFPSSDSDYDLRGVHILPVKEVIGLDIGRETIEVAEFQRDLELDLVTHDVKKFFAMLLKKNGYVLEQLYSPLIVHTTPEHEELKILARQCITRYHVHHYLGFAQSQWQLFSKQNLPKIKPLLYIYRVLLTGIYLMKTGTLETNLLELNKMFNLTYLADLIACKISGAEKAVLSNIDLIFHQQEYERLCSELKEASQNSNLPETPNCKDELNDLLIRIRFQFLQ